MNSDEEASIVRYAIKCFAGCFITLVLSVTGACIMNGCLTTYENVNVSVQKMDVCVKNGGSWIVEADPAKNAISNFVCRKE